MGNAYDDVFRTMLNDCTELIIPVINEVFGEHYSGTEKIEFYANEHFMNIQDGESDKRVTDTSFQILGEETKKYHLECQSTRDDSMLVRFFEYDTQIALDQGEINNYMLTVEFPRSAALFLRSDENTPDQLQIEMKTPGGNISYEIPVMKTQRYTINQIFEKKLLFLIPFHIFSHERELEVYNTNEERMFELLQEYLYIRDRLEKMAVAEEISEYAKCMITDLSNTVLEQLAKNYTNVREGVKNIMVGRVLDYPTKTMYRQGISQGKKEEALSIARNFFLNGLDYETVRQSINSISEEELQKVYEEVRGEQHQKSVEEKSLEQKTARQPMKRGPKL